MDLAGKAVRVAVLGGGLGDDGLNRNEAGVEKRGEGSGSSALDVANLDGAGVEDLDSVGVIGVEGFADEADHLAAADGAGIITKADDVGDDEADEDGVGGMLLGVGGGGIVVVVVD